MFKRLLIALFIGLLIPSGIKAGIVSSVSGRVMDAGSGEPLPFVHVVNPATGRGTTSDMEGHFSVQSESGVNKLVFSYVGYHQKIVELDSEMAGDDGKIRGLRVFMDDKGIDYREIEVMPGPNPAHPIIQAVIDNRSKHDPNNLESFRYDAYNRVVATNDYTQGDAPDPSEIIGDTLNMSAEDSARKRAFDFLSTHHLFIMESIINTKYMRPARNEEEVKAMRVSGFERPYFIEMGSTLQVFNFYRDEVEILGDKFRNPIGTKAMSRYYYDLQDTIYDNGDTIWVISFEPQRNNFMSLEGSLYIHDVDNALVKVLAETSPHVTPRLQAFIRQSYIRHENGQWFPDELYFKHQLPDNVDIVISGLETDFFIVGTTSIKNTQINPGLKRSDFSRYGFYVPEEAYYRDEDYWQNYRDSLDEIEQRTYLFVDSVGEELEFDRLIHDGGMLVTQGYLPWRIFNFELQKLLTVNRYEGIRPGLGMHTNRRLSGLFSVGGYFGYGFGDHTLKYGGKLDVTLHDYSDTRLNLDYRSDVERPGFETYPQGGSDVSLTAPLLRRSVGTFAEYFERYKVSLSTRYWRFLRVEAFAEHHKRHPGNDYMFVVEEGEQEFSDYQLSEAGIALRYAYGEELMRTAGYFTTRSTDYPVLYLKYQRGFSGLLDGDFDYDRFTMRVQQKRKFFPWLGESRLTLDAGLVSNPVPVGRMYTGHGSITDEDNISYFVPGAFQTMAVNEFLHDREVLFNWQQVLFRRIWKRGTSEPAFVIWNQAGWGELSDPDKHEGFSDKSMEQGYFETGFMIENLYKNLGVGTFYRYGPYEFEETEDNLMLKLVWKRGFDGLF